MSEELTESRRRLLQGAVDAAQSCMANGWLANESVVGEHVAAVFLGVLEPLIRADERKKLRQRVSMLEVPQYDDPDDTTALERSIDFNDGVHAALDAIDEVTP
jgi:hypothetical protein